MRLKVPGWLAWAIAALAVLVVAAVVLLHTPQAARWGRDRLVRLVAEQLQLDLVTSRLDVNFVTRRVRLDDVRLSVPGHSDQPFFTARRIEAVLPWAVYTGVVRLSMLDVDDSRVHLVREGGVIVNTPPSSGNAPPEVARRLDLRGLRLTNFTFDYEDRTGDSNVSVKSLDASLDEVDNAASGTLTADWLYVRLGAHATTSEALAGRMGFDGSNITFGALSVPLPEGRLVVDGRVNRALDDTRFALTIKGGLDYAVVTAWTPPPVPVSGTGTFDGTFVGPFGGYELKGRFTSPGLQIGQASGMPLDGTLSLTPPRTVIDRFTITAPATAASPRQGAIEGKFTYTFGQGSSDLEATFRDLDLDVALAAYEKEPLSFAAWQQGTVTLRRASPQAPMAMRASGTSRPLVRADRVALDGTWTATLENNRWFARHDHRVLDAARAYGTAAWPAADDSTRATLSGPLTLDISNVGAVVAAARRSGINLSESLIGLRGPAQGTLAMSGSIARMVISGPVSSDALVLPGGQPATARADIVYDGDSLRADAFELTTPGGRMDGHVVMGMESSRLDGAFTGQADDIGRLAVSFAALEGLTGTATMAGTIGGTTAVPDVPFTMTSSAIDYSGQPVGVVALEARLRGTVVEIARLAVDQGPGVLTGTGTVDYESGAYDLTVDGKDLVWKDATPGAPVAALTVAVSFKGAGTFDAPGGAGTLTAVPSGGTVGDVVGRADVRYQFSRGQLTTTTFFPALRTLAQATIDPRAPYAMRGVAAVNAVDVQPFAAAYGAQAGAVTGTLGMSAAFEGSLADPATLQAFINLQQVNLTAGGLPVGLQRPARVTVRTDDFSIDDLALTVGASSIEASGQFRDVTERPLTAKFSGNLADVTTLARAFGAVPEVTASGALTATWESRGGLAKAQSVITLSDAAVTYAGYPTVQALNAHATFDGEVLLLERLTADWQGGRIDGTARLPRTVLEGAPANASRAGRVDITVKGLTQKALAPWLAPESLAQLDAKVSASLALDVTALDARGISGTFVLDEAAVTAAGVPVSQERPARLSIADGVLTFDDVEFSAGSPVRIGGTVTMRQDTELNLAVTGNPGLRPFSVLSPDIAVDGAAKVDLKITGTPAALLVNGRVDLDAAEIVMRDPQVIASEINGAILFEGDRVTLSEVRGFLNGGDLEASGSARILGVDVATGEFTFQARSVAVEYPKNVDSEIDAILSFLPGASPLLRGDVRVRRGAYRATISVPALVAFNATRTVPVQQPGYLDRLRLDLSVSTEEDIVIDNNYGRFEAGANVRLQGTGTRPALTGRAELREGGEVFLLGGLYRLNESTISFTNPNTIAPEMNISMVTRSNGGEQTLTLTGTLDRLQTDVVSSDPSANTSVASMLLGGSTLTGDNAIRLLSGELLGVTGRAIGLDSLRLERGFTVDDIRQDPSLVADIGQDPATRLTLSKQLSSDVEVVLSQGISQGALSGYVTYRPLRGVELRGTSLDNTDRLFSIRHDISFGGAKAAERAKRVLPKIASVTFDGVPPQDEAALRGRLRLEPGDDFDFIRWRDDVERLRKWYRDQGRLESRVRGARADTADGRVALTYRVVPGPLTQLRVEGMAVPSSLTKRIDEIWSNAVFDKFLLDEIQSTVRFELLRQNTFNAKVETVVESTTPTKVIRVSVTEGQTARRRRIAYEGARALTAGDLDTEVARWGLTEWGWLYPPSIANALYNRYDAEGYRAAVINAAEPVIVGDEAVLTVSIDEGGQTLMTSATLAGDDQPLAAETRGLVSALEGKPYRYGEVDTLVRQVEERYRNAGYNSVRATPTVTAPPATTSATLVLDVDPGRQQRLAEVVVSGADKTREASVVTALRLKPGQPVNFTQWAQGRKRLFDTNVFRQVDVRPETLPQPNADGTEAVRARVTVSEWPTWRLRYGLQLDDTETESLDDTSSSRRRDLGAVANLQNRNLLGRAWTFGVYGRVARNLQSANTYLSFPTFFSRAVQTNLFVSGLSADIFPDEVSGDPAIHQNKRSVSLEQRIRRGRSLEIVYGYRVTRDVQDGIAPDDPFLLTLLTGRFTGSAYFDRRDDPFNASRGWFGAFTTERVSEFESGGDSIKVLGRYYRYLTLRKLVLASGVRIGGSFLDPLTSVDPFFVGGADTVRGYQESRIGPTLGDVIGGVPAGGNALLILNQEVRAPIYRFLRGVAFVDAGNVFEANSDLNPSKLKVGYGIGLRFHTPFSVFRIDLGFPGEALAVRGSDGSIQMRRTPRWYFGLGQVF